MIAGGIVTCVGLLIVARLAPATMSATAWFIVLGIILSDLAIALWLLRTSKG